MKCLSVDAMFIYLILCVDTILRDLCNIWVLMQCLDVYAFPGVYTVFVCLCNVRVFILCLGVAAMHRY